MRMLKLMNYINTINTLDWAKRKVKQNAFDFSPPYRNRFYLRLEAWVYKICKYLGKYRAIK